ncbi:peptide chain release factor N(5)-glutamine methyltransferase [Candidatus Nanosynbacter sp. TM7-057]|uniref:peptide chain release factor N(5)-glutamine methyltransferase n=1 Tax=Candidatus Nanosynbacter sp. TM7-057 TaxID=2902630 RepID=UPI001FB6CC40|nr:peptide chain release factor N(5)-glutamine methyltransferase [Candidatus Nanosynbacter sp. TM7-057]MCJ1964605.1 peptide chain release factor N(5)-glutamine methyltransferase [Candidatus Nanosynbacter sp. TM7-057]
MIISEWLKIATKSLKTANIPSARLDAELILANTLRKNRTYLHAHLDEEIDPRRFDIANARLDLRLDRVPIAYILGYKEFYGRRFTVSPSVLIPRPESEDLISLFLELTASEIAEKALIDVGTGSGCLGITAKLERSNLSVILSDISKPALNIAEKNANALNADVHIQQQSLLNGQLKPVDYIFANLPYVDKNWDVSPELQYEPDIALFAEDEGLKLILQLIAQAPRCLTSEGLLFIEADPQQHNRIIDEAVKNGFVKERVLNYILVLRFTGAQD